MLIISLLIAPISTVGDILKKKHKIQWKWKKDNKQSTGEQDKNYIKSFWQSIDKNGNPIFEKEDNQLYHQYMGGAGTIICCDCGYKKDIVSFLHSFDNDGNPCDGRWGYQCQSCGKFYTLNDMQVREKSLVCSCGGELSRDKALFCPQCKSKYMMYDMKYIT